MFFEEGVHSFTQVPKFWKSIRQKFFEVDLKKFQNFVFFFWKIENFRKVGFQLKIFDFFDFRKFLIFRFSKNFNWNPTFSKIFDFSKKSQNFETFSNRPQKISVESIFKILVPGKNCELPFQKTFRVHLTNA